MDIGNQQRVIIVELDKTEIPEIEREPVTAVEAEPAGDWPLPLDINVEHAPVS